MNRFSKKKIAIFVLLIILVIALPLIIWQTQQRQDVRQRASQGQGVSIASKTSTIPETATGNFDVDLSVDGSNDISAFDVTITSSNPTALTITGFTVEAPYEEVYKAVTPGGGSIRIIGTNTSQTTKTQSVTVGKLQVNRAGSTAATLSFDPQSKITGGGVDAFLSLTNSSNTLATYTPAAATVPPATNTPTPVPLAVPTPDTGGLCLNNGETTDGQTFNFVWNEPRAVLIEISTNKFGNDGTGQPANWVTKRIINGSTNTDGRGFSATDIPVFTYTPGVTYSVRLATDNNAQVGDAVTFGINLCAAPTITPVPTATDTPTPTQPTATDTPTPTTPLATNTPVATPTTAQNSVNLAFALSLQGIGDKSLISVYNPNPINPTKQFTVCLYPASVDPSQDPKCAQPGVIKQVGNLTYDSASGSAYFRKFVSSAFDMGSTSSITDGVYQVLIKTDKYLRTQAPTSLIVSNPGSTAIPVSISRSFIVGDINGDNSVDTLDWNILKDCGVYSGKKPPSMASSTASDPFGSPVCVAHNSTGPLDKNIAQLNADLNDDGFVNQNDLQLFILSLSTVQGN